MKEICIPIPDLKANQKAEVDVKINGNGEEYHYRLENVELTPYKKEEIKEDVQVKEGIELLRQAVNSYDIGWELIQIYNPDEERKNVQVLYRKVD